MGDHFCIRGVSIVVIATVIVLLASEAAAKTGCCWSSTWEGKLSQKLGVYDRVSNYASLAEIESTIHVDYELKKVATDMTVKNGTIMSQLKLIEDFTTNVTYVIVDVTCIKSNLSVPLSNNCIPDDAIYLGESQLLNVNTDTWLVYHPAQLNMSSTRVTVSKDGCIPITQVTINFGDKSMFNVITLQNVTSGIKDPSVFNIPDYCPKSHYANHIVPHMRIAGAHNHFTHKIL